jgi:hypothetical protein
MSAFVDDRDNQEEFTLFNEVEDNNSTQINNPDSMMSAPDNTTTMINTSAPVEMSLNI